MTTIVTRAGKGLPLTNSEVDSNFTNLNNDKLEVTTAASTYQALSGKNAANGYAGLDASGLVPSFLLPSYVDDVLEYASLAAFPATGETGKIYVALDSSKTYRWSGSAYIEISPSPGSTDSLTEGSVNLYFTQARARGSVSATQNLTYDAATGLFTGPDLADFLTISTAAITYQPLDADLTAIAALAGTSGLLKKTGADTWSLDTSTYLTGNQSISLSGDASGSGTTAIALTLANSGVAAGTYNNVATEVRPFTVDAKGRITDIGTAVAVTPAWSSITSKPTTLAGYGITDAAAFPTQTGNAGKFLTTNGSAVSWGSVEALPPQAGNAGKYLTTNGTTASWQAAVIAPSAPTNVAASLASVSSVSITFTAGLFADSHRIYYSTTNPPTAASSYVSAASGSGSVTGLAANTTYYFRVGAVNSAGVSLSDTVTISTPPAGTTTYSAGQTLQANTAGASGTFFCGANVTTMTVELVGGGGNTGGSWNASGGAGAGGGRVAGIYTVGSNKSFTYYVGGGGLVGTEYWRGGAGGGASAVVIYGTFDAIAAAGGGGGGGAGWNGTAGAGTAGGSILNQAGPLTVAAADPAMVGSGGNPGSGRNGGKSNFMVGAGGGGASGYGEGGASNSSSSSYPGGGGGGGGYAGGAGGGNLGSAGGGGRGGTSYLAAGMAAANTTLSNGSGSVGTVKITFG